MATYPLPSHKAEKLASDIAEIIAESRRTGLPVNTLGRVVKSHSSTLSSSTINFHSGYHLYIQAESEWEEGYDPDTSYHIGELAESLLVFFGRVDKDVPPKPSHSAVRTPFGDVSAMSNIWDISVTLISDSSKPIGSDIGDDLVLYLAQLAELPVSKLILDTPVVTATKVATPETKSETKVDTPAHNGNMWFQVWTPELTVPERADSLLTGGYHEEEAEEAPEPVAHEETEPTGFTALNEPSGDTDGMWFTVWTGDGNEVTERTGFTAHTEGIDFTGGNDFSGSKVESEESPAEKIERVLMKSLEDKDASLSIVDGYSPIIEDDLFEIALLIVLRHKAKVSPDKEIEVSFPLDHAHMAMKTVQDSGLDGVRLHFHRFEVEPAGYQIGNLGDFSTYHSFRSRQITVGESNCFHPILYIEDNGILLTYENSDIWFDVSLEELKDHLRLNK